MCNSTICSEQVNLQEHIRLKKIYGNVAVLTSCQILI